MKIFSIDPLIEISLYFLMKIVTNLIFYLLINLLFILKKYLIYF